MPEVLNEDTKKRLNGVFRQVFDNDSIQIDEAMTARDIEGWDSLTHVNLIVAVEKKFKISFTTKEVSSLRNVGGFLDLIIKKLK
ncbi:MAG: acyl carrier protein [Candidatus Omnitrophica bacterium CG1_02_46_14]|nr:MAG: acyl carrier protein [Candidatus Omnitrophica bacterium CG1_02_46_14]